MEQGRRSIGMVRDPRAEPGARAQRCREAEFEVFLAPGSAGGLRCVSGNHFVTDSDPRAEPGARARVAAGARREGGGGGVAGVEAFAEEGVEFVRIAAEGRLRRGGVDDGDGYLGAYWNADGAAKRTTMFS